MRTNLTLLFFLVVGLATFSPAALAFASQTFGTGANTSDVSKISDILATPDSFMDKDVTIKGTIVKVCKKRGCWMELASDKRFQSFRIKVRDGDMVFPMTAMGKTAFATGKIQAFPLSLERTKSYLAYQAQEMNEDFDPASVTEPITVYQLAPHGVTIED